MNLLNDKSDSNGASTPEMEQLQLQKQEYYFLGSFIRTRGLRLYGYNYMKDELTELNIQLSDTIHLTYVDGKPVLRDYEAEKCMVDSRLEWFEALNIRSAENRVKKYREGKILTLCNLKRYNPDGINFFK